MYCQICLEAYNIANRLPKNLGCGHTFCDKCLKKIGLLYLIKGNGYEIECPKCRKKSRNNLPICYAIYDNLLIESKSDLDEPCKIHEYEKIQFYCNNDNEVICALCLCSLHKGHFVSSIKDKILSDEINHSLDKWKKYFNTKDEEFLEKKKKLILLQENLDKRKMELLTELNQNYEKIIKAYSKEKNSIEKEIDELYETEYESISLIKSKLNQLIVNYNDFLKKYKDKFSKLDQMDSDEILSFKMNEFYYEEKVLEKNLQDLMTLKSQIRHKSLCFNDEKIFGKKEMTLDDIITEGNKTENYIVFFGDSKDRMIISFNLQTLKWSKLESSFGVEYEFLDYSCVVWLKNDILMISGGCVYSNYKSSASKNTYIVKFNPNSQITFYEFEPMNIEKFSHGSVVLNGVPYVFGGHSGYSTLNVTEYYDEKEKIWKIGGNMNIEREIFAYCTLKDRYIYIFGGFNDNHLDTIEKYDSLHHKWRLLNIKMKKPLQNASAVAISDDQIVLIGGYNGNLHKSIDILNISSQSWTSLDRMKMTVPRRRSHCYKFEEKIYIFGGEGTDVDENIPEVLDLKTNNTSNFQAYDLIISKSLNFWSSSIVKLNKLN